MSLRAGACAGYRIGGEAVFELPREAPQHLWLLDAAGRRHSLRGRLQLRPAADAAFDAMLVGELRGRLDSESGAPVVITLAMHPRPTDAQRN